MATTYAYLVPVSASSNFIAGVVNSVNSTYTCNYANCCNAVFSIFLSVGYDTVKHAKYRC